MSWLRRSRNALVTGLYLRPGQVIAQLRQRLLGPRAVRRSELGPGARHFDPMAFLAVAGPGTGQAGFVGEAAVNLAGHIDWRATARTKLWRYNLHYFDYLHWRGYDTDTKSRLLDSWIAANPPGTADAWEPYPISLRTVNWIKYFWAGHGPKEAWLASLALQLAWLDRNLEYHLLANHLLKNAKALVFGGLFFAGPQADAMLRKGMRLMAEQAREQFLPDGGHYERSVMYHAISLEDLLDVLHALGPRSARLPEGEVADVRAAAERAWQFLADVLAGDGEIPLFNDAAFGIAPAAAPLLDYGRRILGAGLGTERQAGPLRLCKPDTGYFGYRQGGDSLIIDCGPGGPDYQPGHTHADALSYELCLDGRRIVVDSGVFDYENTPLRHYLRGTAAHNTVQVDGQDQSEVWGAFRVARRARPLYAELGPLEGGRLEFRGAHDGYRRLPGRVVHERRITANLQGTWDIKDQISGAGEHLLESIINLHPACTVKPTGERDFLVSVDSQPVVRIVVAGGTAVELTHGIYCPEFGKQHENAKLVLRIRARLPAQMSYTIQRA